MEREDLISRVDSINTLKELEKEDIETYGCKIPEGFDADRAIEKLKNLPSADKTAKWLYLTYKKKKAKCSNCGLLHNTEYGIEYCPHCGAKMESEV